MSQHVEFFQHIHSYDQICSLWFIISLSMNWGPVRSCISCDVMMWWSAPTAPRVNRSRDLNTWPREQSKPTPGCYLNGTKIATHKYVVSLWIKGPSLISFVLVFEVILRLVFCAEDAMLLANLYIHDEATVLNLLFFIVVRQNIYINSKIITCCWMDFQRSCEWQTLPLQVNSLQCRASLLPGLTKEMWRICANMFRIIYKYLRITV